MVKLLITTIQVNLVPLFTIVFLGATLFLQLGCFGLDITSFCICMPKSWPMADFGAF